MADVVDNPGRGRSKLAGAVCVAFADHRQDAGRLIISHLEAPSASAGLKAAGRLM